MVVVAFLLNVDGNQVHDKSKLQDGGLYVYID